jgi:hypothetical protein
LSERPGRIVVTPQFLLLDSIRGIPISITLNTKRGIYISQALNGNLLKGRRIRAFLDLPKSPVNNKPFFAIFSSSSSTFYGGVVDFGPILYHGLQFKGEIVDFSSSDLPLFSQQSLIQGNGKILVFKPNSGYVRIDHIAKFAEAVSAKAVLFVSDDHSARISIPRSDFEIFFTIPILYLSTDDYSALQRLEHPIDISISISYERLLLQTQVLPGSINYHGINLDIELVLPLNHNDNSSSDHRNLYHWKSLRQPQCSFRCFI